MNHEDSGEHSLAVEQIQKHRFITFLVSSIVLSLFFVYIALSLYHSSGTLQLDLSRPGFDQARKDITEDTSTLDEYNASGSVNNQSLQQFNTLYSNALKDMTTIDAFSSGALDDKALQIPSN